MWKIISDSYTTKLKITNKHTNTWIVRGAFKKVPMRVNLSIHGPFRALIQMAKGMKDPTTVISPVMPFPLDTPGIVTETRTLKKEEDQDTLTPTDTVDVSTSPQPSE